MQKNSCNQINQKFFREIAFLAVFPVQKLIFDHFWNCKKWNLVKKIIREIDLFDFTSFFGLDFFNFLAHCDVLEHLKKMKFGQKKFGKIDLFNFTSFLD